MNLIEMDFQRKKNQIYQNNYYNMNQQPQNMNYYGYPNSGFNLIEF